MGEIEHFRLQQSLNILKQVKICLSLMTHSAAASSHTADLTLVFRLTLSETPNRAAASCDHKFQIYCDSGGKLEAQTLMYLWISAAGAMALVQLGFW